MAKQINLAKVTFKKIETVGDLIKYLSLINPKEKVFMFRDEEGNQTNKVLCLELYKEGLTLIPWGNWEEQEGKTNV